MISVYPNVCSMLAVLVLQLVPLVDAEMFLADYLSVEIYGG
jgi:hypothetical protein